MDPEEKVARRARMQYGLISHRQAIERGMAARTIRRRVAQGAWSLARPGVYVVGGVPPSWEQTLFAVVLAFDDCWISHGTAARLLGHSHAPEIGAIEVLRPYGRFRRLEGVVAHRSRIITPADVTTHKGIPVTSRARSIVECSGRLTVAQTGRMLDEAIRRDTRQLEETRAAYARLASGGRRRLRGMRAALAYRLPGYDPGESDLEITTLRTIISAGLPLPVQQYRVVVDGRRYRIDLAYPALKIAIELAGWRYHAGRESFDDDKARMADLVSMGWRGIEITSRHEPDRIVRWISGALAHAAA